MGSHVITHYPGSSTSFLKLSPHSWVGRGIVKVKCPPPPNSHSWVERGIVKVKCFLLDNTVIPIRTKILDLLIWNPLHWSSGYQNSHKLGPLLEEKIYHKGNKLIISGFHCFAFLWKWTHVRQNSAITDQITQHLFSIPPKKPYK